MATFEDLGAEYIQRLRRAARIVAKSASPQAQRALRRAEVEKELKRVFEDLERLTFSDGTKLASAHEATILRTMDRLGGFRVGTFEMVKKGSIESTLMLQQYASSLADQLELE